MDSLTGLYTVALLILAAATYSLGESDTVTEVAADTETSSAATEDSGVAAGDGSSGGRRSVFEIHRWLFLTILIFISISIVLTTICCICIQCKRRRSKNKSQPKDEVHEEPAVRLNLTPAMQEQTPPNDPLPIDEENGWIIPLDQMTPEELEKPEVQILKL